MKALPPRINPPDRDLTRVQDFLRKGLAQVGSLATARLIEGIVTVGGTPQLVAHGLGRPYQGYLVGRVQGSAQVTVRETSAVGGVPVNTSQTLGIIPSGSGTIDLWVY